MTNQFLPEGHEELKLEKKYWKLSQFKEGETRFRIVSRPIAGWVDWKDNKPYRYKPAERPKTSFDPAKPMRRFWVCHVWDYAREDLYVLDITQNTIIHALTGFGADEDWGDFTKYDIKIKKEGAGKDTKYTATPMPHKPLSEKVIAAIQNTPVRLEALYESKDPWRDLEPEINVQAPSVSDSLDLTPGQQAELQSYAKEDREGENNICSQAGILDISHLDLGDYQRAVNYFTARKMAREAKAAGKK